MENKEVKVKQTTQATNSPPIQVPDFLQKHDKTFSKSLMESVLSNRVTKIALIGVGAVVLLWIAGKLFKIAATSLTNYKELVSVFKK